MGLGIEHDVAKAELGEGIALLRQAQQHIRLGRLDVDGADRARRCSSGRNSRGMPGGTVSGPAIAIAPKL